MRSIKSKNFILSITGAALLCIGMLGSNEASALSIDPSASLPGIPMAGAPSFNFNDTGGDYSNTIDSWYTNIVYIQDLGAGGYTLYAYSEGNFTYWEDSTTSYQGYDGIFDLQASYDANGVFQNGTVTIDGLIPGVVNTNQQLMRANLTDFAFAANLVGFEIDGIVCPPEIVNCLPAGPAESIYFYTAANFPDIGSLAGDYQTTMASKTTVPVPAAVWLMLSGLGLLGAFARRQRATAAA